MEAIYLGIKNIAAYLILVTVLLNLMNGNAYRKYVELVCGMVLILIVLMPLTGILSLDEELQYQFHLSDFEIKMREEGVFKEAEEIKQRKLQEEYQKLIRERISRIVEDEGRCVEQVEIHLSEENYGVIEELVVKVSEETDVRKGEEELQQEGENKVNIEQVEVVEISLSEEGMIGDILMEKNKTTEAIRKRLASELALQEERIIVYQEGR